MAQVVKRLPAMWEAWFDPWVGKIPWRRRWQPTPIFLPGEFRGLRSLMGYNPRGRKEAGMTEWFRFHFLLQISDLWAAARSDIFCLACTVFFQISNQLVTLKGHETSYKNLDFYFFFLEKSEDLRAAPWEVANQSPGRPSPTTPDNVTLILSHSLVSPSWSK